MSMPLRLLIHGASGRMGRSLLRLAAEDARFEVIAAASRSGGHCEGFAGPVLASDDLSACAEFDIAIDFSLPPGFDAVLELCRSRAAGLVSGTTGISASQRDALMEAGKEIPVVWASNFSLGVVVLEDLIRRAALALPGWHAEITETHHVHKKDAPSGTALTLANAHAAASGTMPAIASIREGEVVGDHRIRMEGPGEWLELRHHAEDRDIFARGALEAAARLHGRKLGLYSLADLVFQAD
jgi:4-hydroxy-tetrahydrodipicolinate reductase